MPDDKHPDHQRFLTYWDRCADQVCRHLKKFGRCMVEEDENDYLTDDAPDERIEKAVQKSMMYYLSKAVKNTKAMKSALQEAKDILR